ncbi:hypothetical protein NQ317_013465 [Molorchus minor]|uniref:Gag protein n=1 Tax=Molorchus minor TaxID=1323400 RepID=A0ABQ9J5S7_9CUCU|nr:hypothetical protein NQ317_013465 [Molorchus minor]
MRYIFPLEPDYSALGYERRTDVSRWDVKYDGRSSVNNFLQRVEELRLSRGVSKQYFSSWDDLLSQLREAFQPYDYENGIWDELRRRTQGAQERVVVFVTAMEQLFNRLSVKPPEEERLRLIRRNLLPYIQKHLILHEVNLIRDLVKVCRSIEETEIRTQQFCPPPTNYRYLLEPDLAYRKPSNPSSQVAFVSDERATASEPVHSRVAQVSPVRNREPSMVVATCWNCQGTGHRFRQCNQPRKLFCYKCGHENVTTYRCPRCSKNLQPGRHVANGQTCESTGSVLLPIQLADRVKLVKVLVVPSIPHHLILGVDFWTTMGIIPDLFANEWSFRSESEHLGCELAGIHPIDSLTDDQREILTKVIDEAFSRMGDKLG